MEAATPKPAVKPAPAPPLMHGDDQAVLARFQAEEAARREQIAACAAAKQAELAELKATGNQTALERAQLGKDEAALKQEAKDIKAAEKGAKTDEEKAALQKRKDELAKKQTELNDQKKKNNENKTNTDAKLKENAKKNCPKELPKGRHCVAPDPKKKMDDPLAGIGDNFNKVNGTKIDFDKLVKQESAYSGAYVPWWPIPKGETDITMTQRFPRSDDPKRPVIAGGGGHSGVTIGVGVDFGDQGKDAYMRELDATNKKYGVLTENENAELKKKIDPYIGKMRAEACAYLAAHPFDLGEKELRLLHTRSLNEAYRIASSQYPGFNKKSAEEQTSIFKNKYNVGGG